MRPTPPELGRIRLDPMSYEELRQQVQHRDGLRCQSCGSMWNLESTTDSSAANLLPIPKRA